MPTNLNHLLNTPVESFPHRILAVSTNAHGRINSALIKINRQKLYIHRRYRPNGSSYFHIETP